MRLTEGNVVVGRQSEEREVPYDKRVIK